MNSNFYGDPIQALISRSHHSPKDSSDRIVAQILLKNICNIPKWAIEQAAETCSVSVSTCRRFIQSLGFVSFSEFKIKVSDVLRYYDFVSPPEIDISKPEDDNYLKTNIDNTIDDLRHLGQRLDKEEVLKAVHMLHEYSNIYIHDLFKTGMSMPLEKSLAINGKMVCFSHDILSQQADATHANANSCFLLVNDGHSHSREIINTIKTAHSKNAKIILITHQKTFPGIELCDIVLYVGKGFSTLSNVLLLDLTYHYIAELYKCLYVSGKIS